MNMATTGNQLLNTNADHNSNSCLGDTLGQYWANKELGSVPTSIYISSLPNAKDLSYDDLSKNFDANLAEMDMETFRTEDILTLPVMYSGDFQCSSLGEQCASMSGSLLSAIDLDDSSANISVPTSSEEEEEEIFASKNEPLFSPVRDAPQYCTISVDSLDCSYEDNHDLLVTKKNNYTIVFEGSEESDYLEVCGSSDGEDFSWKRAKLIPSDSMVHSDLAYTTWSKLRRTHPESTSGPVGAQTIISGVTSHSPKSQSLPNLLRHSLIAENLAWPIEQNGCVRLFDLQHEASSTTASISNHNSLSLLKLYMKQKSLSSVSDEISIICGRNSPNSLFNENSQQTNAERETNNNTIRETDNSLYLEDSLMGHLALSSQIKEFKPSPIKEEDESTTDTSTGEETLKPKGDKPGTKAIFSYPSKISNSVQVAMTHMDIGLDYNKRLDYALINQATQTNINGNSRNPSPCSSGYISGIRFPQQPSAHHVDSLKKSGVIIERPCCRSTQIPIPIRDQGVQTSLDWPLNQPCSTQTSDEPQVDLPKRSIYVCYPNYSLPDLSFLQGIGSSDEIYLTPTEKHVIPDTLKVRRRPKSCTDTSTEPTSNNHIRDWDSLSLLLPEELKNAILRLSLSRGGGGAKQRLSSPSPVRRASPTPVIQRNVPKTLLKKSSSSNACTNAPKKLPNKRHSLQEPAIHYTYNSDTSTTTTSSSQAKPIQYLEESLADVESQEEEELPPQEFAITPTSPATTPPGAIYQQEINKKSKMVGDLQEAVQNIVKHFENASDKKEKIRLGNGTLTPALVPKVVRGLCAALETILSDGLQPYIPGLFGMVSNSLWRLIEASTKQGHCKKEVVEVVSKVNATVNEGKNKTTSFIIGLLNAGALEWWLGHLLGVGEVLAGHFYQPGAFIRLIALPGLTYLRGELKGMVAPLTGLPFHLSLPQGNISLTRPPPPAPSAPHATWDLTGPLALHHHTGEQLWPGVTVYPFLPRPEPAEYKFQKLRQKWEQMASNETKPQPPTSGNVATPQVAKDIPIKKKTTSTKPPISPKKPTSEGQHSSRSSIPRSKFHHVPQSTAPERSTTPRRSLIPVHKSAVNRRSSSLGKE